MFSIFESTLHKHTLVLYKVYTNIMTYIEQREKHETYLENNKSIHIFICTTLRIKNKYDLEETQRQNSSTARDKHDKTI